MLVVLNWVAVGLFVAALVICGLAWAGRVRFDRWLPPASSRPAGRAFALLDAGALMTKVTAGYVFAGTTNTLYFNLGFGFKL